MGLSLLIPSIGKHFPRIAGAKVYVQCRFNNEILTTDPADHSATPIWDTELAWDVGTKLLSFLRSQRSTLKLVCYSIDASNRREALGYVMLDLRGAAQGTPPYPEKWYPLVHTKSLSAFRPEIKLIFTVLPLQTHVTNVSAPIQKQTAAVQKSNSLQNPKKQPGIYHSQRPLSVPVALKQDGYYQVGDGTSNFTLWITIAFAETLDALVDGEATHDDAGFYFCYSLLGNEIKTERFFDLDNPNFPAERVSIKFRGTQKDLTALLHEISTLVVYLYKSDAFIGFADVALSAIFDNGASDAALSERIYPLYNAMEQVPLTIDGKSPSIGLSLVLSADETSNKEMVNEQTFETAVNIAKPSVEPDQPKIVKPVAANLPVSKPTSLPTEISSKPTSVPTGPSASQTAKSLVPWRQFRFSIELRSLQDIQLKSAYVYLRYVYTPFGTSSPISTHPAIHVTRSTASNETILPNPFCAFEFVMSPSRLETYLEAVPLIIELWHKDDNTHDVLLGNASVDMSLVLKQQKIASLNEKDLVIQNADITTHVMSTGEAAKSYSRAADLRVVLALEDFGAVEDIMGSAASQELNKPVSRPPAIQSKEPMNRVEIVGETSELRINPNTAAIQADKPRERPSTPDTSIHDTDEYKAALELELWKKEEETKFREHLKQREMELNERFANEWKYREKEREALLKRKLEDYKGLEGQLQKLTAHLEARERQVQNTEREVAKQREDLEREMQRTNEEVRDSQRRVQEEFKHRIELEKQKFSDVDSQRVKALRQCQEYEDRYRQLEQEFIEFKRSLSTTTEATIRAELTDTIKAKAELEKQVETLKSSKKHYKSQLRRVFNELAATRKQVEAENQKRIAEEKRQVDQMRLQMLAKEQIGLVNSDKNSLVSVRKELEMLGQSIATAGIAPAADLNPYAASRFEAQENMDPNSTAQLERLKKERQSLLDTNIYLPTDSLIRELESRIAELEN